MKPKLKTLNDPENVPSLTSKDIEFTSLTSNPFLVKRKLGEIYSPGRLEWGDAI